MSITNGTTCCNGESEPISAALNAVFVKSGQLPIDRPLEVVGPDFDKMKSDTKTFDIQTLIATMKTTGYQATALAEACDEINRMITCRLKPVDPPFQEEFLPSSDEFKVSPTPTNCTIFLSYTSNLISSGIREILCYLVQHSMVDCIVTTAGGIEEDIIKCLSPTFIGSFSLKGIELREKGINRIGNILAPNDGYCAFEDWITPILNKMLAEQTATGNSWSPSRITARLGKEINDERSVLYWAFKNKIPVFCPAITDGSVGDMLFFHSFRNPGIVVDILDDLRRLNTIAMKSRNTGMVILGGGVVKHHVCNANLMRNGADFSVFVNTSSEFDGSDAGASPDEAVSWGKIRGESKPVKVFCDATVAFPLIAAGTFVPRCAEIEAFIVKTRASRQK